MNKFRPRPVLDSWFFGVMCYCCAIWQLGVGIVSGLYIDYIIDAAIWTVLGILTHYSKSRIIATIIFIVMIFGTFASTANQEAIKVAGDLTNSVGIMAYLVVLAGVSMYDKYKNYNKKL